MLPQILKPNFLKSLIPNSRKLTVIFLFLMTTPILNMYHIRKYKVTTDLGLPICSILVCHQLEKFVIVTPTLFNQSLIISVYNARSLFPKINSLATDMHERKTDVTFISEIWEKLEKKKHQQKIEELFELKGIKYVSNPRRNGKRGGGAALAVNLERFTISKLNIHVPRNVEAVWALLRPKSYNKKLKLIIVCCFYSPPNLRTNPNLINHLIVALNNLLNIHKDAGVILAGDRNDINISSLLAIEPSLRQIVTKPTLGNKILDVVCTNLHECYTEPQILPPLSPDVEGHGVPSDHSGVLVRPSSSYSRPRVKKVKFIRPMSSSLISAFRDKLGNIDFAQKFHGMNSDSMTDVLETITTDLFTNTFPEKKITVYNEDKPWFNEELSALKRKRLRVYTKHGKCQKYIELSNDYSIKVKAVVKHIEKIKLEVTEGKRGSAYPVLKRLAQQPNSSSSQFSLPSHCDQDLTPLQSAEVFANHFSKISCEYEPLVVSELPANVKAHLATSDINDVPILSLTAVYSRIIKTKKPKSIVEVDLPKKLVKECAHELAKPAQIIFNSITHSSNYPIKWKNEHQSPIPKIQPPETEDDLRNIAKTPFLSKVFEAFLSEWLLSFTKPHLHPNQCGLKDSSINHYLIKLLHFVHQTLDLKRPSAVLVSSTDLSKGFNRVDHSLVVQDLFDKHTPPWLLRIICSYLTNRTMTLTYKGAQSSTKKLPGSTPQGALLGGIIFIVKFNEALMRPAISRNSILHGTKSETVKYIDDGSAATAVNLRSHLIAETLSRPLSFSERTGHILPAAQNLLQHFIQDTEAFTERNKMSINKKKTTIMKFTNSKKYDFPLELNFSDGSQVETTEVSKCSVS